MLHRRVEHYDEIVEYKISGFTYYSKTMLKEIEELLRTSMPLEIIIESRMLCNICIVLRLNELEILQWYLFVYLFVKEDVLFA